MYGCVDELCVRVFLLHLVYEAFKRSCECSSIERSRVVRVCHLAVLHIRVVCNIFRVICAAVEEDIVRTFSRSLFHLRSDLAAFIACVHHCSAVHGKFLNGHSLCCCRKVCETCFLVLMSGNKAVAECIEYFIL